MMKRFLPAHWAPIVAAAGLAATGLAGCAENTHLNPDGGLSTFGYDQSTARTIPTIAGIQSEDAVCPLPYLKGAPLQEGIIAHDAFFYAELAHPQKDGAVFMNVTIHNTFHDTFHDTFHNTYGDDNVTSFSAQVSSPTAITLYSQPITPQQEARERRIASEFYQIASRTNCDDTRAQSHFILIDKRQGLFALTIPMEEMQGHVSSYLVARVEHNAENVSDVVYVDGWDASTNEQVHATAYAPGPNITIDLYRNGHLISWAEAKRAHPGLSGFVVSAIGNFLDHWKMTGYAELATPKARNFAQNGLEPIPAQTAKPGYRPG